MIIDTAGDDIPVNEYSRMTTHTLLALDPLPDERTGSSDDGTHHTWHGNSHSKW